MEHEFLRDQVYLCVPEGLFRQYYTPEEVREIKARAAQGANLRDFARLPFSLMTNRLESGYGSALPGRGSSPMCSSPPPPPPRPCPCVPKGLSACCCTHMNLVASRGQVDSHVNIFPLWDQGAPLVQNLSLLRHKQRYLTHFAKYSWNCCSSPPPPWSSCPFGGLWRSPKANTVWKNLWENV